MVLAYNTSNIVGTSTFPRQRRFMWRKKLRGHLPPLIRHQSNLFQEEQLKRRQAERDFLDLMESIEHSDLGGQRPEGAQALASKRLSELQVLICVMYNLPDGCPAL